MIQKALFILALVSAASCASRRTQTQLPSWVQELPAEEILLTYQKTPCFGACPHFDFYWYADGSVVYEGKNFVERKGRYKGQLDVHLYAEVLALADSLQYFSFDEIYNNPMVSDLPSTTTVLRGLSGPARVENRYRGPESLETLYTYLDMLLERVAWEAQPSNQ